MFACSVIILDICGCDVVSQFILQCIALRCFHLCSGLSVFGLSFVWFMLFIFIVINCAVVVIGNETCCYSLVSQESEQ